MPEQSNPYAAPASRVDDIAGTSTALRLIPEGRAVPAGHGWQWLASAWDLFKRNPGAWILITLIFLGIVMLCSWIPFIGFVATYVLSPVLLGGVMLGCAELERGGSIEVSHLFAGFREKTSSLVVVGLLYLAGGMAILVVVGLTFGFSLIPVFLGQAQPDVGAALQIFLLAALVMLALSIPLVMAIWFAAPLVMLHDMKPVDALKASFLGCIKNVVPFLIYGVIAFLAAIIATLPLLLGWLVLGPVIMGSVYTGYRDIFTESAAA
jgi:uncharacterized membrane protein